MNSINKISSNILARLRGVATGGSSHASEQRPMQNTSAAITQSNATNNTAPKRDIKELYDFIDKYCEDNIEEKENKL